MARRGAFSANLDPFGSGRGGLGRYNVTGETISSLEEMEAYAVAVAWSNGQATDEQYLASLKRLVDVSVPGSRQRITNENKLGDAQYSIGRNVLAAAVNKAVDLTQRTGALRALLAYDQTRLATMIEGSEAQREQTTRIAAIRGEMRQASYADLVTKVNAGQAATSSLLELAREFVNSAGADPDLDEWQATVTNLVERVADEGISEAFQAYQHDRMKGEKVLVKLDARMKGMDPNSAQFKEYSRQREDLVERIKSTADAKVEADVQGKRSAGKMSDKAFLGYLSGRVRDAVAGTTEWVNARNRLKDFTFSLAEDKLRTDVQLGKRPASALAAFYRTARAGMDPGSERYRQLSVAIQSLDNRGGGGGGGGGGRSGAANGTGKNSTISTGPKLLGADTAMTDVLGRSKAPPQFADLFRINVESKTALKWWDNNVKSMNDAKQDGATEWTYYDQRGNGYQMPFTPSMMVEMDGLNLGYMREGLNGADSAYEAQTWVSRVRTATDRVKTHGAEYTMDAYEKTWRDLDTAKQRALAAGRYGEYANLSADQRQLVRDVLGLKNGEETDPFAGNNSLLTGANRDRLARDLAKITPQSFDDSNMETYNPDGDVVLGLIKDRSIETTIDRQTGEVMEAKLNPDRGYRTQLENGEVAIVPVDMSDERQTVFDEATGRFVPAYTKDTITATIRYMGEDVEVQQAVTSGPSELPLYYSSTGAANTSTPPAYAGSLPGAPIPGSSSMVERYYVNGASPTLPVKTFRTYEKGRPVSWVSIDGQTWLRIVPESGQVPRIVLAPGVTFDAEGKTWMQNGKEIADFTTIAHWWGSADAKAEGKGASWGSGAPGVNFTSRQSGADQRFDARSPWVIASVATDAQKKSGRDGGLMGNIATGFKPEVAPTSTQRNAIFGQTKARPGPFGSANPFVAQQGDWNTGEIVPSNVRPRAELPRPTSSRGIIPTSPLAGRDELGLKPTPSPSLPAAPTVELAPTVPFALNPITGFKLPPPPKSKATPTPAIQAPLKLPPMPTTQQRNAILGTLKPTLKAPVKNTTRTDFGAGGR